MAHVPIIFQDRSPEFLEALERGLQIAAQKIGNKMEGYAKLIVTDSKQIGVDLTQYGERDNSRSGTTGALRNQITNTSERISKTKRRVIVGTNVDYAIYHELGTGVYASQPGGRQGWWIYIEGQKKSGGGSHSKTYATKEEALKVVAILRQKGLKAHATQGIYPLHFLRHSVEDHILEYRDELKLILKSC